MARAFSPSPVPTTAPTAPEHPGGARRNARVAGGAGSPLLSVATPLVVGFVVTLFAAAVHVAARSTPDAPVVRSASGPRRH